MCLALLIGACAEPTPVGEKCYLGADVGPNTVMIAGGAVECESRICMSVPRTSQSLPDGSEYGPLCSATCEADSDCVGSGVSPCQTGFSCQVATVTGRFQCTGMCVCNDFLSEGDRNKPAPAACED